MRYLDQVPFDVSRKTLYTAAELYEGFDPDSEETFSECFDSIVYQQYKTSGQHTSNVNELLARTLHDHRIHTALARFLKQHDPRCYVGVMADTPCCAPTRSTTTSPTWAIASPARVSSC